MQRRPLMGLLLAIITPLLSLGQSQGDLSLTYTPEEGLKAEFWYWQDVYGDSLALVLYGAKLEELRLSQGRLKQSLDYQEIEGKLWIKLPRDLDPRSRIYLKYRYSQEALNASPFFESLDPGLIFNAYNLEEGVRSGVPGWLIPSGEKPYENMRLGLLFPEDLEPGLPLEEDYEIELQDGRRLMYYQNEISPLDLAAFYLAIGEFRRFDAEDLLEDLQEKENLLIRGKLAIFEQKYQEVLGFLSRNKSIIWTDDELAKLEGLEGQALPPSFLGEELLASYFPKEQREKQYAILSQYWQGEELLETYLKFWQEQLGPKWIENLNKRFEAGDSTELFWDYYSDALLSSKGLSWEDSSSAELSKEDLGFISLLEAVKQRRKPLQLNLKYGFKSQENRLYFFISQADTTLNIRGMLSGELILKDEQKPFNEFFILGLADTLAIELSESPRTLYLNQPDHRLLRFVETSRPLNYWLYDLSKAPSPERRRAALLKLLDIAGPNLLATVVGIDLDSGEPELQHLALSKVKDLKPNGRLRLESTLRAMAQDNSNVKLMQKAEAIVKEFWPE